MSRAIAGAGTKGLGNGRMRGRAAGREAVLGECYERSITLVDCRSGELREALRGMDRGLMMVPEGLPGYDKTDLDLLERSLSGFQIAERWSVFSYPFDPTPNDTAAAVSRMQSSGGAVLCTLSRGPEPPGQRELATAALETGKLRAGVALLDPYGLARLFPTGLPGVATYGFWPECLRALLETLFAPVEIGGHREAYGPAEAARLLEAAGSVSGASRPSSLFTATGVLPVDIHRSG